MLIYKMKLLVFLWLFTINLEVFSHDIPNCEDISLKKIGCVIKTSGDTIKGEGQILETFFVAVYLVPFKQDEIKIIVSTIHL